MLGVWEAMTALPPPEERDSLMVVGGLWKANVRGMTALGLNGSGMALAPAMLAQLRSRFAALADTPLLYAEAARARMSDPQRFVLCISCGWQCATGSALRRLQD
jgi:tryptophan 2,3-dioxygenase